MSSGASPKERLAAIVEHQGHLLPSQGPIGVFIHHNTLHAFQHLPFEQAVEEAAKLFETEPYMTAAAFRQAIGSGRIRPGISTLYWRMNRTWNCGRRPALSHGSRFRRFWHLPPVASKRRQLRPGSPAGLIDAHPV